VRFSASTNRLGRNALDFEYLTFGFKVFQQNLANTAPINFAINRDLMLPARYASWQWSDTYTYEGVGIRLSARYDGVAQGAAIAWGTVAAGGVRTGAMTVADVGGSASAQVTGTYRGNDVLSTSVSGNVKLADFLTSAYARMSPVNGQWKAEAGLSHSTWNMDEGGLRWSVNLPIIGTIGETFFRIPHRAQDDQRWSVSKVFTKQF
jgi:hypothetical protein